MVGLGQLALAPSATDSLQEWWWRVPRTWPKTFAPKIQALTGFFFSTGISKILLETRILATLRKTKIPSKKIGYI
jgi:hypothetical protein